MEMSEQPETARCLASALRLPAGSAPSLPGAEHHRQPRCSGNTTKAITKDGSWGCSCKFCAIGRLQSLHLGLHEPFLNAVADLSSWAPLS